MPKPTFFNLDREKREAIIKLALEEFARQPYEQASLTKIVEACGIAKGSMYQYFQDKLDLYLYIVDLAYEKKRSYVNQAFSVQGDIFAILEEYYHQSYIFSQDYPLMHQVANNFWDSRARVLQEIRAEGKSSREEDFHRFLTEALASGAVNEVLDPAAIFFVYHAVGKGLIDHFGDEADSRFVSAVLDVLKYGLKVRKE